MRATLLKPAIDVRVHSGSVKNLFAAIIHGGRLANDFSQEFNTMALGKMVADKRQAQFGVYFYTSKPGFRLHVILAAGVHITSGNTWLGG